MAIDKDTLYRLTTEEDLPELDLSWLKPEDRARVEATRLRPGRKGLTLDLLEAGQELPDASDDYSARPRGAERHPAAARHNLYYPLRHETWSDNVRLLYEEAVQRQWSSATDIPWHTLKPLPDDVERAWCQFATFLTEVEFIAGDTPGQWLERINPEWYEVKLFLLTQIMDEARHLDVFRKRALANGGGLLMESGGGGLRIILECQDFSEFSAIMHVFAEALVQTLFRSGEALAYNEAEKAIFRLCAQDESRHIAFGVMHLKHILETQPWRREEIHYYLDKIEGPLALDMQSGASANAPLFDEAIMVLAGGGRKNIDKGFDFLMNLRRRQVMEYLHRLEVAGLPERRYRMNPTLRAFIET